MPIKIETEKVVFHGVKCYEITAIDALTAEDLPEAYTKSRPRCTKLRGGRTADSVLTAVFEDETIKHSSKYQRSDEAVGGVLIIDIPPGSKSGWSNGHGPYYRIGPGSLVTEEKFKEILNWVKICGERLHKINKKLEKENEGWEGSETFVI